MIGKFLKFNSKKTALYLVSSVFVCCFFVFFPFLKVDAAATSTLRGKAWWGIYGDLYFNCLDYESGSHLDVEGNLTYPPGFSFYSPPCSYGNDHFVGIDTNNNFFGKAWNFTNGFVAFSGTSTPPDNYASTNANCASTCNLSNNCYACYNEAEKKIYGFAQIESSGEWINLNPAFSNLGADRPLYLENCATDPLIYKQYFPEPVPAYVAPGDFYGIATSSSAYLFFNCLNDSGSNNCVTRNYKVYNSTLTIGALTAPDFSYLQACQSSTALGATLGWCVRSGQQTAYEILVHTSDFGPSPSESDVASAICHSGKKYSEYANQYVMPNYDTSCGNLDYGKDYYWWIRLYNENNEPTIWYQYYGNTESDTDLNRDENNKTFSTFKHKFPSPYLFWPEDVFVGTSTEFTSIGTIPDDSVYYTSAAPTTAQSCSGAACVYLWETSDALATISSTTAATTSIIFYTATSTTVSLSITDEDNYMCKATLPLKKINYDLPIWREVKAR